MSKTMMAWHRVLGLVMGVLILIAAGTALALNHQDLLKSRAPAGPQGPYGKYQLSIAADPTDAKRLLMGTNDGLFRSEDGGRSWDEVVLPVPAEQVNTIAYDPRRTGVVYACFREIGVFKSTDGGEIWEELTLPFYAPEGTEIAGLGLKADGALVLSTTAGIYTQKAPDGEAWDHVARPKTADRKADNRLVQLAYDLHDGNFWGEWGVWITDAVSLALIVLVFTGYGLYFGRALKVRQAKRRARLVTLAPVEPEHALR